MKALRIVAMLVVACSPHAVMAQQQSFVIGTGGEGGVYFPTGKALCAVANGDEAASEIGACIAATTDGSVANINGIRSGEYLFGITQSDLILPAYRGEGRFADQGPYEDIRALFSLHAEPLHVLVREDANISSVEDFKGKRVNIGNPGSGTRVIAGFLLEISGLTVDDLELAAELDTNDQSIALCDGRLDAVIISAGLPNALAMEATINCDVTLLDLRNEKTDLFLEENEAYAYVTVPGGTYPRNPEDVTTWGPRAVLIADNDTPDQQVKAMLEAVFDDLDSLRDFHPALRFLDPLEMKSSGLAGPIHDGAVPVLFGN